MPSWNSSFASQNVAVCQTGYGTVRLRLGYRDVYRCLWGCPSLVCEFLLQNGCKVTNFSEVFPFPDGSLPLESSFPFGAHGEHGCCDTVRLAERMGVEEAHMLGLQVTRLLLPLDHWSP